MLYHTNQFHFSDVQVQNAVDSIDLMTDEDEYSVRLTMWVCEWKLPVLGGLQVKRGAASLDGSAVGETDAWLHRDALALSYRDSIVDEVLW